jgi:hypothetical protein
VSLVEEARRLQRGDHARGIDPAFDEVWVVFDWDGRTEKVCQALQTAERYQKIHIALSNPSFELWLLWHFADFMNPGCDQKSVEEALSKVWLLYRKDGVAFGVLAGHMADAMRRAESARGAHRRADRSFPDNRPSSEVDNLIDRITSAWRASQGQSYSNQWPY